MLSALISSAGRKPAMLLAEQLAHESCVRPGPLVLGTALLKSLTPTEDRDRHSCYRRAPRWSVGGHGISAWLCMSPCRSDHIFTSSLLSSVRHMVSEDSGCVHSVHPSIPTASVHGERLDDERGEPLGSEMNSVRHRSDNAGEDEELPLLRAQEGLRFEEGDHPRQ